MPARRLALCLCGGGATGAAYEIGVLAALETAIPGFSAQQFDVIVGTSAGSLVAAVIAAGVPIRRLYDSILADDGFFRIERTDVYQLDWRDFARKLGRIGKAGTHLARALMTRPVESMTDALWSEFAATLPDGLFSLHGYIAWVDRFLARNGLARHFDRVGPELLITANNLDTGHREVFGRGWRLDASLAEAIGASSAIPLFFTPVRIHGTDFVDGGTGRVAHVDLVGKASHVLVINPVVPWNLERRMRDMRTSDSDASGETLTRIRARGMLSIWNQSFRMSNNVKLHMSLRRFRADRPGIGVALIEPDERDETLFVTNALDTEARARIARHAFETTLQRVLEGDEAVRAVCLGHADAHAHDGLRRRQPQVAAV
jgi:predicted acylesterase/phospholipase RssA